ncbi:hypothetical protein P3X46_015320 [Hevea brasiliensis]|uniref:BZIP domain-containing protein n=1 Tax=Hevea brasiliensis TaxID=3981 RepID=A0ABQ9LYU6_HEVBR|nr:hypothetical protein P3X46_015320 [Hevea brasiliensis]
MNSIFSVDDFSDLLWQPPVPVYALAISSSASEWELLEEFPSPASSSARENTAAPSAVSQSPTSSKPRNSDDDMVDIEKPEIPAPPPSASLPRDRPPQPLDRASLAPADSEYYHAFLKFQLDLPCAAAGKSRPEGVSSLAEDQRVASKNFQSGSQVSGNGNGILKAQSEADGGSLRLPALPSTQRKQYVPARKTASGYSREDSDNDDLDGDIETNEHMDPADEKRARRMESNRESARRSRRRKQAQLNELEAQFGQLRDECTSLLTRLSDINKKCDEASADNRILTVNIETLRTKVKMAEDQVKRATDLNPVLLAGSNMPSVGMQFVAGQTDASARVAVQRQPNNNHLFHRSVPNISPQVNIGGMPFTRPLTASGQAVADDSPLQHVQKDTLF